MTSIYEYKIIPQDDQLLPYTPTPFDIYLSQCWDRAVSQNILRYTLEGVTTRSVEGDSGYGFIAQNNPKRLTHKRAPVDNRKLTEPFSDANFHFNKISDKREILCTVRRHKKETKEDHLIIINVSPIEYCHSLLVPNPTECLPQIITEDSLLICLELLSLSQRSDFCIVANSLLAYASVNHLHYHFLYLNYPLMVKRLSGATLYKGCHQLIGHPMNGFGFQSSKGITLGQTARNVYRVIQILLAKDIPHNLMILRRPSFDDQSIDNVLTVILVPRRPSYGVKTFYDDPEYVPPFFVAACEIGGFVPIIDQSKYSVISERDIAEEMKKWALADDQFESLKSSLIT